MKLNLNFEMSIGFSLENYLFIYSHLISFYFNFFFSRTEIYF